jgi:ABC-2 type transport system ATP-binding protein
MPQRRRPDSLSSMISIHGLTKSFGRVRAVDDLSFTVPAGQVTGLLGPNGAGKTTTMRMLLGLVRPDHGQALIGDLPYTELARPVTVVGAVLEATAFHPGLTARVHLGAMCRAAGLPLSQVADVLDVVDLTEAADRRVGGFSLGMRQRLALASALLGGPSVLVLDEPANGLDPQGMHWLRGFLRAFAADGRTVLVSSHGLAELNRMADRVVVVEHGRLVAEAPVEGDLEEWYLGLVGSGQ